MVKEYFDNCVVMEEQSLRCYMTGRDVPKFCLESFAWTIILEALLLTLRDLLSPLV